MKTRPKNSSDSLSVKARLRSGPSNSKINAQSGFYKLMDSSTEYGEETSESTEWFKYYTFPAFTGAYPDKVMVGLLSPYQHMLLDSGPTFGTWSYSPVAGRYEIVDGFRYSGIYTEIYSAAGVFSWYRHWQFTLDLYPRSWGMQYYASYVENPN